ncbi:MAG: gamma-butyrobetaine hydroxylase-like domain-containing protein [Phycisphaerales bacterium]
MTDAPTKLDLKKDRGLTVEWADGTSSYYSIAYLRRMSPSAEMKQLREQLAANPLTVLPSSPSTGPLVAESAELVGTYALRIRFSDGHDTGIYSWGYLREIDPAHAAANRGAGGTPA